MKSNSLYLFFLILMIFTSSYTFMLNQSSSNDAVLPEITTFRGGKQFAFLLCWDDGTKDLEFSFLEDEIAIKYTTFAVTKRLDNKLLWGLE